MKKAHLKLTKFFFVFCLVFLPSETFADNVLPPDWNYFSYREKSIIFENADIKKFEKIRCNYNFQNSFDKQEITRFKNLKNISPKELANAYLARTLMNDNTCEKYIIKNNNDNFEAIFCSAKQEKCEIIRYFTSFDGIITTKYTHNNIWHFQNNIGSFVEFQNRIRVFPDLKIYELYGNKEFVKI
ncbi:MAG: hypothetical protein ACI37Z_08340 [Candidatus Gastranaerophilaceae bacterium]